MANHKSALKRIKQNDKSRIRNKGIRSALRSRFQKFETALASGDFAQAQEAYRNAESALDRAANKGIIPRSRAARKTSRLAQQLNALEQG